MVEDKYEYKFDQEYKMGELIWKIYEKEEFISEEEAAKFPLYDTPVSGRAINPFKIAKRIGICGDKVREFPSLLAKGQSIECISTKDGETKFIVNT